MRIANGWALSLTAAALAAGCLTVNVYFPAPEVRAAAEEIVQETWGDGSAEQPQPDDSQTSLWRRLPAVMAAASRAVMPATAHAAEPDIDISTAAIRQIKSQMSSRAPQLKPYLRSGALGIGNDGLLVVRDASSLNLKDQAQVRRLVEAENRDRKQLYQEIAKANDLDASAVSRIQQIFAETWIANAEPGWWVQKNGNWTTK